MSYTDLEPPTTAHKFIGFEGKVILLSSIVSVEKVISPSSELDEERWQWRGITITLNNGHKITTRYTNDHSVVNELYDLIIERLKYNFTFAQLKTTE